MIPWIEFRSFTIGPVTLQTWGTLVGLGFLLGTYVAYRRAKAKGLEAGRIPDLAFWIFFAAFIGARLFHVLFYDPSHYLTAPWDAINPALPGYSMFGGLFGAAVVFFSYMHRYRLDWISYADAIIWGLPWGCGVGRLGCFLIHDHPGTLTNSIIGVRYPGGSIHHDHGLYLSLIGFATGILFLLLNRKPRRPGFWFGAYLMIEGVTRFVLDFYRIADATYFGLTPTQYLAIPLFGLGLWMMRGRPSLRKT